LARACPRSPAAPTVNRAVQRVVAWGRRRRQQLPRKDSGGGPTDAKRRRPCLPSTSRAPDPVSPSSSPIFPGTQRTPAQGGRREASREGPCNGGPRQRGGSAVGAGVPSSCLSVPLPLTNCGGHNRCCPELGGEISQARTLCAGSDCGVASTRRGRTTASVRPRPR
jgi:hypothetical protein